MSDGRSRGPAGDVLTVLRRHIRTVRARIVLRYAIEVVAVSLGVGATVWLAARLGVGFGWTPALAPLGLGAIAALATAVVGGVATVRRIPSATVAARAIDRAYGWDERAETAVEIHGRPAAVPAVRLVQEALFADVHERAAAVEPARVAPIRVGRTVWASLGLAVVCTAVVSTGWIGDRAPMPPTAADVPLEREEAETFTVELRETAELIRGEAEASPDPYVEALARAFDGLGERLTRGEVTRAEFEAELAGLMEHAERTLGDAVASAQGSEPRGDGSDPEPDPGPAAEQEPPPNGLDMVETQIPLGEGGQPLQTSAPNMEDLLARLRDMEDSLRAAAEERERMLALQPESVGDTPYFAIDNTDPQERSRSNQVVQGPAAGAPVGGAQEANRGEGDLAGRGAQPIGEGEAPAPPDLGSASTEDVALPDAPDADGERVDREFTPRTERSEVADARLQGDPAAAEPAMTEFRSEALDPRSRVIASRYFDPNLDVQSDSP